ncbi:gag-pol polyprotein [Tanacetum coccineum]
MKHPKGIAKNVLVRIGKFVFLVEFIILDMPEDVNVPLILEWPFMSTDHAKFDVFKRKITLRVRDEKIIFKSVKPASSLIKRVYMLSLRERMDLDLEARLMGETLILNRSFDPLYGDYIKLSDLNKPQELRRNRVDDLEPTVEEGEVVNEPMIDIVKTRCDFISGLDDYPSDCDFDRRIHIDFVEDMDPYLDEGMGDVIVGEPFCKASCVEAKRTRLERNRQRRQSFWRKNPLLTKETESEPIIWDIGDEEEEYPFVNEYPKEELMSVYDTDIEDVIEKEEGCVGKGGFGGEEYNIEDDVVMANDFCSSVIQTILSVDFEEDINTKSHELMSSIDPIVLSIRMLFGRYDPHHLVSRAMLLMVERNCREHLIHGFAGRGNEPDPRDVKIASLKQQIQELDFPQLQQDSPAEETEIESNVWDDGLEDVNPFGGGNPLLIKETESEPIIWDIGYEEEEYPFVNDYPSFKKEPIMFVEDESCPVYDTDNEEEELMPVYDTDIEDVIKEEEGCVGKGGFGREEDNIEDVVVVANDLCHPLHYQNLGINERL